MFPAGELSSSPPLKIRKIIGPIHLHDFGVQNINFAGGVYLSRLNLDGSENHPSSPSPTQPAWSNGTELTWLCKLSHTSHGVLKFAVPNPRKQCFFQGRTANRKSPQTGKPVFNHRLEMGNIRDLLVSLGSSISRGRPRGCTRMMKNLTDTPKSK